MAGLVLELDLVDDSCFRLPTTAGARLSLGGFFYADVGALSSSRIAGDRVGGGYGFDFGRRCEDYAGHARHGLLEIDGRAWYLDPWSRADYASLPKADVILITDIHGDHMDPKAIAAIRKSNTQIVAPAAVAKTVTEAKVLANGETTELFGVQIEAIPMYNVQRGPAPGKLFHDKGRGNGYVLTVGGKRFYFSGDTEGVAEMRNLKNIDVAFVCMNLPYTMPPDEAADGCQGIQAEGGLPVSLPGFGLEGVCRGT